MKTAVDRKRTGCWNIFFTTSCSESKRKFKNPENGIFLLKIL
jgi:hypothetical protein